MEIDTKYIYIGEGLKRSGRMVALERLTDYQFKRCNSPCSIPASSDTVETNKSTPKVPKRREIMEDKVEGK